MIAYYKNVAFVENIFSYIFSYDFVHVYDGDSPFSSLIVSLTGIHLDNVASTGPDIYIRFVTDNIQSSSGFRIRYDAGKNCFV